MPAASGQATTDAQSQLNNLKSQQQASEAAMAQDNQNQMSAATSAANAKIADLNHQMSANNASQAAANSAALASGTAQINQAAQSATNAENASYSQAVASQQAANSQALAEASKNIVTPAQKQAQTSAENANYQAAVNDAQAAHNAANAQLKSEYDAASQKINDQITSIQNQQTAEQKQKLADATAKVDGQINAAAKAAQDATAKVNADQTAVASAQAAAKTAQSDFNNASQKLNDAKQESPEHKQLSTDYPQYHVDGENGNYVVERYADQGTWNDTDPVDQATKLHFDANGNLSEEDQNIANVFAANIINYMRKQIGTPLVKVSAEGNAMQKRLMDLDHQLTGLDDMTLHHTIDATQQLMNSGAFVGWAENAAESSGTGSVNRDVPTVADLKNEISNTIWRWILERGNVDPSNPYGHRYNLLGIPGYSVGDNPTVALTTRVHGRYVYCTFLDIYEMPSSVAQHYVSLENNGLPTDSSKPAVDINALQAAVDAAKTKLNNANAALKSAQSQLATDQAAAKTASAKLNQLKANRDQAIKDLVGTADPATDRINALKKQASDLANNYTLKVKAENDQYNQKLASLKADHEKKLAAIKNQPSDVNALKAQLEAKLTDLKTKHEAALKKIAADAQAKIDALKKQLSDNTAANQPILDQITQIKADLAKKQKTLDDQLAALKASDAAAYAALHDKLFPKNTDVVNGKSDHMTTDDGHEIVLPGDVNQVSHTTEAKANESRESRLPQTGSSSSIAAIALGTVAAMLGLGLAKKREF